MTTPQAQSTKGSYEVVPDAKPKAIVVYCSDPRFQIAFEKFIEQELSLPKGHYLPIVVGGGAGVLAHPEQLPKEFKFLRDRFEFYREIFPTVRRVILINHEDCRYYDSIKDKVYGFLGQKWRGATHHSQEDLAVVAKVFTHLLSHLGVTLELYYAKFADAERTRAVFQRMGG